MIKSTLTYRFIYWPDQKPEDLVTDGASRFIACLETLPFQEGTPLPATTDTPTEIISRSSEGYSIDRQVCAVVEDSPETSRHHQDRAPADISADELSANAPANETKEVKSQWHARNAKHAE